MKKLISFLGIISITASTGSVAACSTVNNIKTSIKNKIQNLTQVSSTALRGAMIQKRQSRHTRSKWTCIWCRLLNRINKFW